MLRHTLIFLIAALGTVVHADTVIDTISNWSQSQWIGPIGQESSTIGQSFTVPNDTTQLNSVSVALRCDLGVVKYAVYVARWDGSKLVGPLVYQSAMQSAFRTNQNTLVTIDTGGVSLVAGQEYMVFLSSSQFYDGVFDQGSVGYRSADVYLNGEARYANVVTNFDALWVDTWGGQDLAGADLAFKAVFSVPQPKLLLTQAGSSVTLSWSDTFSNSVLEACPYLGATNQWQPVTNAIMHNPGFSSVTTQVTESSKFFRLKSQ